jgi:hypothetical protein
MLFPTLRKEREGWGTPGSRDSEIYSRAEGGPPANVVMVTIWWEFGLTAPRREAGLAWPYLYPRTKSLATEYELYMRGLFKKANGPT